MSYVMTAAQFVATAERLATDYKTLYVMGAFGAPMTAANKTRYINNGSAGGYNKQPARAAKINAASSNTFGVDCCGLTKAILWGWNGDKSRVYGGAGYACNGVPDLDARGLINACRDVSATGWDTMLPGEEVWMDGHCGIYVGRGLAVESTPIWRDGVQYSAVAYIGPKAGYNARKWTKHGKLPWVDYSDFEEDDNMTGEEIYNKLMAYLNTKPTPDWVKKDADFKEAVARGVTDGKRPCAPATRYEAAIMSVRASKKK